MDNHMLQGWVTSGLCGKGSGKQTTGKCGKQPHVFFRAHRSSRPSLAEGVALTLCVPPFQLLRTNEPFYLGSSEASCLAGVCNRVSFPQGKRRFSLAKMPSTMSNSPGEDLWDFWLIFYHLVLRKWREIHGALPGRLCDCHLLSVCFVLFCFSLKREIVM